jgi:glycosyltransferase involved in cell wall biosynthesis
MTDAVHFAGERRDTPDMLRAMDLFVLPSIAEGISNTILEAMASGLPVLATDVGGNGELVVDGKSGFLFPSGDGDRLAELMARCIDDAGFCGSLGTAARARCLEHFSLAAMASAYERLYREVGGGA